MNNECNKQAMQLFMDFTPTKSLNHNQCDSWFTHHFKPNKNSQYKHCFLFSLFYFYFYLFFSSPLLFYFHFQFFSLFFIYSLLPSSILFYFIFLFSLLSILFLFSLLLFYFIFIFSSSFHFSFHSSCVYLPIYFDIQILSFSQQKCGIRK